MVNGYSTLENKLSNLPIKKKILLIVASMIFIRIGSVVPLPFVNTEYMKSLMNLEGLGFLNALTGSSFQQMSLFALSISPYITASIIIQLLTVAIPSLEEMKKDGKTGQDKIKKMTKYTAIALALIQSLGMAMGLGSQGLLNPYSAFTVTLATVIWTVGAVLLIYIGDTIEKLKLGSGISMILVCNIASTIPSDIRMIYEMFISGKTTAIQITTGVIAFGIFAAIVAACVTLSLTLKKIQVTHASKFATKMNMANNVFPIPLMTCSVMPVIFASSIMSFPLMLAQFVPVLQAGAFSHITATLNSSMWFNTVQPIYTIGAVIYLALTTLFTHFYLSIGFNCQEIANNFKHSGTVIPGVRPGKPTAEYLEKIVTRVAIAGNYLLTGMILLMHLICNITGLGALSIAGTSIFICVNVILEMEKIAKNLSMTYGKKLKLLK